MKRRKAGLLGSPFFLLSYLASRFYLTECRCDA